MRRIFFLTLVIGLLAVSCRASEGKSSEQNDPNYPNDPEKLVRLKLDAVVNVLKSKKLDEKSKAKNIAKIVSPAFDFPLMGKLALGKEHWPRLDKDQQEKYIKLFQKRLITSYCEKIGLYKDEVFDFKETVKKPNKTIEVVTELAKGDSKYVIVYKLRKNGTKWKVYDVGIQGVSILLTYRSQFNDILQRNSVEEFLKRLEKQPEKE